jgi:hypothetical protein
MIKKINDDDLNPFQYICFIIVVGILMIITKTIDIVNKIKEWI